MLLTLLVSERIKNVLSLIHYFYNSRQSLWSVQGTSTLCFEITWMVFPCFVCRRMRFMLVACHSCQSVRSMCFMLVCGRVLSRLWGTGFAEFKPWLIFLYLCICCYEHIGFRIRWNTLLPCSCLIRMFGLVYDRVWKFYHIICRVILLLYIHLDYICSFYWFTAVSEENVLREQGCYPFSSVATSTISTQASSSTSLPVEAHAEGVFLKGMAPAR